MNRIRILVIRPIVNVPEELQQKRLDHLRRLAFSGTEIEITSIEKGPVAIETEYDAALAVPGILRKARQAEKEGFDAIINSCAADPGLYACRQAVSIPVVGTGESSHLLAASLGRKYSIITVGKQGRIPRLYDNVIRNLNLESKVASIRGIGMSSVLELRENLNKAKKLFIEESKKAIIEDGADVIVPGCAYFSELVAELQKELEVPIIDPAGAALKMAETLVCLGLTHSKIAFPCPSYI